MTKTTRLTLRLPPEQAERLKARAKRERRTLNSLLTQMLDIPPQMKAKR